MGICVKVFIIYLYISVFLINHLQWNGKEKNIILILITKSTNQRIERDVNPDPTTLY